MNFVLLHAMKYSLLLLACAAPLALHAQSIVLAGRVLDEQQRPVPYASVGTKDGQQGTATNEAGEFSLRVPSMPQQLEVLSIGYTAASLPVSSAAAPVTIVLKGSAVALPEVRVRNPEALARELVQRTYAKLLRHQRQVYYGKAFYRQKTRQNGSYREFFDAFYDVKFNNRHIEGWDLAESRYAVVPGGYTFTNFSSLIRVVLPTFNPRRGSGERLQPPLGPYSLAQFYFTLREIQTDQGRELAVISFEPKLIAPQDTPSGTLYIDVQTATLRRREMVFSLRNRLSLIADPDGHVVHDEFRVVSDYAPVADSLTRLASTRADAALVLQASNGRQDSIHISGQFFFYQYTPRLPGHAYTDVGRHNKDLQQVMAQPYNRTFWIQNSVVKDSPLEEKLIRDLEEQRVFRRL